GGHGGCNRRPAAHERIRSGSVRPCVRALSPPREALARMNESDRPQVDVRFLQRRRLLIGAGALLSGCAEPYIVPGSGASEGPQPVATLEVHGRVEVVQGGRLLTADDGMPMFAGDDIRTFASSYAQCRFANGNRVWLDHET